MDSSLHLIRQQFPTRPSKFQKMQAKVSECKIVEREESEAVYTSNKSMEKTDEHYLQEFKSALGEFYKTMLIEDDDETLLRFLVYTDYDIDAAIKMIHTSDKFLRTQEHLLRIPFEEIRPLFEHEAVLVFKERDAVGRKVVLFKVRFWDIDIHDMDHVSVAISYAIDELMKSVETQKKGFIFIIDFSGVGHMRGAYILSKLTRQQIMLGITAYQNTFPVKIGGIFAVNVPFVVSTTYSAFKYFIKKKLRDRVHFNYSGPQTLHKHFSKEFLPESLMGNMPDEMCQDQEFLHRLQKRKCRFAKFQP